MPGGSSGRRKSGRLRAVHPASVADSVVVIAAVDLAGIIPVVAVGVRAAPEGEGRRIHVVGAGVDRRPHLVGVGGVVDREVMPMVSSAERTYSQSR